MKGIVPLTILIAVLAGSTSNHSWGNDEIEQQRQEGSNVGGLVFAPPTTTRSHLHSTTMIERSILYLAIARENSEFSSQRNRSDTV